MARSPIFCTSSGSSSPETALMVFSKPTRLCHWPGITQSRALRQRVVRLPAGRWSTRVWMGLLMLSVSVRARGSPEVRDGLEVELLEPFLAVVLAHPRVGCGPDLDLKAVGDQHGGALLADGVEGVAVQLV